MEETEKKKTQERLAMEETEKKKTQKRLAMEEEEKKKHQARLARIAAKELREKERLSILKEQKRIEQERLAEVERRQKALRIAETKQIEQIISEASMTLANGEYTEAGDAYRKALAFILKSEFKTSESYEKLKNEIENALQNDDIVYGSIGYIYYKDKWFAPDAYNKELLADGFVRYKDGSISYKKLEPIIEDLAVREVRALLREYYTGQQVHKKQIELEKLLLTQNTLLQSRYAAFFNWEVWTFNDIDNGACFVEVFYDVDKDEWNTLKAQKR
ncbi:MAG: hypothetical protein JRF40_12335 [Deltaproteobacteria bacterium]|nr:hypothetical protein [Deltaproteobacteria bacterium]